MDRNIRVENGCCVSAIAWWLVDLKQMCAERTSCAYKSQKQLVDVEQMSIAVVFTLLFYILSCLVTLLLKLRMCVYSIKHEWHTKKNIRQFRGTDLCMYRQHEQENQPLVSEITLSSPASKIKLFFSQFTHLWPIFFEGGTAGALPFHYRVGKNNQDKKMKRK
jgi:hypothetical protein